MADSKFTKTEREAILETTDMFVEAIRNTHAMHRLTKEEACKAIRHATHIIEKGASND